MIASEMENENTIKQHEKITQTVRTTSTSQQLPLKIYLLSPCHCCAVKGLEVGVGVEICKGIDDGTRVEVDEEKTEVLGEVGRSDRCQVPAKL